MKVSKMKRAIIFANIFNLLVAIYFIIISIVSLVHLRWYHQLTMTIRLRHVVTSATSYSAFIILLLESIILLTIFITTTAGSLARKRILISNSQPDGINLKAIQSGTQQTFVKQHLEQARSSQSPAPDYQHQLVIKESNLNEPKGPALCWLIFLHLISSILLIIILVIWLLNTGELVRDSISTQLDSAFAKYQFTNRSNHYSVAIDGMQYINNCCGSLDYTDFPHQRISGLSSGRYPGSCCGKHVFGVNARVFCVAEEIIQAKQTYGCTNVLANYYDLMSILVVPASLICLFLGITIIASLTISKGLNIRRESILSRSSVLL